MNLADNLKKIRKDNNLSQEQLAEKLGVSRQSVSKWESNQAYPEMDKVLQICNLFNLNIDELLNQDIKEVNDAKQSKININKYIEDFLDYVTKTIDMFSSLKFKEKIKCLFEQFIVVCFLAILFAIIGAIGSTIIYNITSLLPFHIQNIIYNVVGSIYLIISLILGVILLLHIFKVRYLDYYIIEKNNNIEEAITEDKEEKRENKKIILEKKKEKVVIRDPDHSGYKFISLLLRCILWCIKVMAVFTAGMFCFTLIFLVIALIVSFMFAKTGLIFFGSLLIIIASISINIIILILLYHFIISKKNKKTRLAVSGIASLFMIGIGSGLIMIGVTEFNIISEPLDNYKETEVIMPMNDNLFIHELGYDMEYVESDSNDIKVVFKHSKYYKASTYFSPINSLGFHFRLNKNEFMNQLRQTISDINNKKIVDYSLLKVTIYTSKENIEKLKNNEQAYRKEKAQEGHRYDELYDEIASLNEDISKKEEKIYELEEEVEELEEELENYNDNEEYE